MNIPAPAPAQIRQGEEWPTHKAKARARKATRASSARAAQKAIDRGTDRRL